MHLPFVEALEECIKWYTYGGQTYDRRAYNLKGSRSLSILW